ncbi:hypothetical protein GJ700_29240 [Duganella sp. FT92W]|uniref:Uncharacterized protein n=1 Tax=Pseudoduganella rivuli TaxID=2666085 RepID=A0A7X2ITG7_9BURK|nr:hypothetical protein [Pseudoduganella rivuli]MRV75805.1 hypothetical protein [Pseudoduganella rivuli]
MKLATVFSKKEIDETYELGIFASGYETRSTFFTRKIGSERFKSIRILGFLDGRSELQRESNDAHFQNWASKDVEIISDFEDEFIFEILNESSLHWGNGPVRIFVDYSVMTRSWYAAILTWLRHAAIHFEIEIDFAYTCGIYEDNYPPLSISEIESLPGFEGVSSGFRSTTAIFGLGYDKYATLAVYDRIEPDNIYCCVAKQWPQDESAERALIENSVIVDSAVKVIELPLIDVAEAMRQLCDHLICIERDSHIVVVPMGPKTHVLATLLMAIRLPWITCLHAKGERIMPVDVLPSGKQSITRLLFVPDKKSE